MESKSDFKFVIYEKLDGDAHTTRMLEEEHHGNVPEEITDKQLDSHHVGNKDTIMEDLLEKTRTGGAEIVLERNLDTAKNEFGIKHRNPDAYTGDYNKIEENRDLNFNREKTPYESASETPKRERWWEVKSKDGLKVAFKKEAEDGIDLDGVDWDFLENREDEFSDLDEKDPFEELNDSTEDFMISDAEYPFDVDELGDVSDDLLKEVSYTETDVGGTPTASGVIKISNPEFYDSKDDQRLTSDLKDHMTVHHDDLPFSMNSFDLSKFDQGVVTYQIGMGGDDIDFNIDEVDEIDALSSRNFSIVEATKKK